MVSSHAKNNTTQANLTHYERSLLRKESQARRVGGESFKPLDSCYLCLSKLSDPVSCQQGHMYCRECVISNLITQKATIEAQKREMDQWEAREARERADAKQKARERVVRDFERGMGLGGSGLAGKTVMSDKVGEGAAKFKFDQSTVERVAQEAEDKAMRTLEAEQLETRKAKLPAFWLPSLAPEGKLEPVKDIKLQTLCHVGVPPHPLSRKTLLPVILTYPAGASKPGCPSCSKELSNSTSAVLLSSRKPARASEQNGDEDSAPKKKKAKKEKEEPYVCGHVVCLTCSDTIVKPGGRCCVCEAEVDDAGRIPLGKEGTGFAAAGGAEVKKSTIAFRV